jgi:transcriptional antiterminator NusG
MPDEANMPELTQLPDEATATTEATETTQLPDTLDALGEPKKPSEARWYVVHTYSGYENKVKANIEKIVENRGMNHLFDRIIVPVQEVIENKNNKKKVTQRKIYPGYVLLKMVMTDDTWFVVRNARGVTSFVGPASKPVPLTDEEILTMGIEIPDFKLDFEVGELVRVMTGSYEGSIGNVQSINIPKQTVTISLSFMGRETPTEFDYHVLQRM